MNDSATNEANTLEELLNSDGFEIFQKRLKDRLDKYETQILDGEMPEEERTQLRYRRIELKEVMKLPADLLRGFDNLAKKGR